MYVTIGLDPYNGKPVILFLSEKKSECTVNAIAMLMSKLKINERCLFAQGSRFPCDHLMLDEPYAVSKQTAVNIFKLLVQDITKSLKIRTIPCSRELFKYIEQNGSDEFDNYQGLGYCGWSWEVKKGKAELKADKYFKFQFDAKNGL